eukprot:TRINITY_DN8714_c0_g1_i14.p1 TRINITY_DN8714_c0_g1~~TRINITY_DN8714_c0_g1_i14.p1  ORF type:complete len:327 (+),score=121.97 TRINITY_DN8714_c0_g1_i14:63-1043(+)
MKVVPSDLYAAVRSFLEENELSKTLKALDKEMSALEEAPVVKPKKAKALADLEVVAACQVWLDGQVSKVMTLAPSDLFPSIRQFLLDCGLNRSLKALDKETSALEDLPFVKPKKAKALAELELVAACQTWLEAKLSGALPETASAVTNGDAEAEAEKPKKKKRKAEQVEAEEEVEEPKAKKSKKKAEAEEEEVEEPKAKKEKKKKVEAVEEAEAEEEKPEDSNGKKKKKDKKERTAGVAFSRIDYDKCIALVKDSRLLDNTHLGKAKFGGSQGDSWADRASEDMLKVKGKGFRKEMQKKKRASWKGTGELDQGVNSIKFADSSDEE